MRVIVFKLFFWLYVARTVNSISDQNANIESKNAYIESELKNRLGTKSQQNRYVSIFNANSRNSQSSPYTSQRWLYQPSNSKYNDNNLNSVHLRHSKHPNLNAVSTRLDELRTRRIVATTTTTTTTTTPKYQYQKYRAISDNLLTEEDSIEELFDYDDDNDDSDNLPDYDSWDSTDKDDDDFEDDDDENEWQAEEATETPLKYFGTENRSKENIVEHSNSNFSYIAAFEHTIKMNSHRCHYPLPRVLSVQKIHPDPGKSYMPHCTVLHRCSADTGCCNTHSKTCAPMKQTVVYLYFYTTSFGQQTPKIEKLPFYNHTECACLEKPIEPTTMEATTTEPSRDGIRSYRSNLSVRAADSSLLHSPETIRRCKCPTEYNSLLDFDNKCSCDCADNNKDCIHIKRGNENFSLKDRMCITNEECGIPKCEYGPYIRHKGRCPGKKEKLDAFASVSPKFK